MTLSDPDLAAVTAGWPALPATIRQAILVIVRALARYQVTGRGCGVIYANRRESPIVL